jgi:hypothetical protein
VADKNLYEHGSSLFEILWMTLSWVGKYWSCAWLAYARERKLPVETKNKQHLEKDERLMLYSRLRMPLV